MRIQWRETSCTQRRSRVSKLALLLGWFLMLCQPLMAAAQLLEQVDFEPANGDTLLNIGFSTTVQYLRHRPSANGSLIQIEFQITGNIERGEGRSISETRRVAALKGLPAAEVTLDMRANLLTVRFSKPVNFKVAQGANARTLTVRLIGLKSAAEKTAPRAAARSQDLGPGKREASVSSATPSVAAPEGASAPQAAISAPADVEESARAALAAGDAALAAGDAVNAIHQFNRVLNLPPNAATQRAQARIGRAREANGEIAKARAEYQLYLKLYPDAPDVGDIRNQMAVLETRPSTNRAALPAPAADRSEYSLYGSVSSYYYHGSTKYDASLAPAQPGLGFDQVSLTSTDQNSLVTNLDLTGRLRGGGWDNKIVVRNTQAASFVARVPGYNRLGSAYLESSSKTLDLMARGGRQSSPGYGVLGRFDGLWLRKGLGWGGARVSLVAGTPVEYYPSPAKRFFATAVDLGPIAERWSGNVFLISQRVDGAPDRRGVGGELRYLDPRVNGFALVDYDPGFKALNTLLLQGNWQIREGTGINILFDKRRSPTLQLTNALIALPLPTVRENLDSDISIQELRDAARVLTPTATLFSIGITHQLSPSWQLAADYKYSSISPTGTIGAMPAQPGSGRVHVYGLQAIRTGFLSVNDIVVTTVNIIRGDLYSGELAQFSHVWLLRERWRLESTLRFYQQLDTHEVRLTRISPSVRLSYRWLDRLSVEGEAGAERSQTHGPMQSDTTLRRFFNLGLRYDFL